MTKRNSRNSGAAAESPVADWVLLRGLARESGHWGAFPKLLKQSVKNCRVHTLDLPGAGIYSGMRSYFTIHEMTDFVREKLQEEDHYLRSRGEAPIERAHLIAISLGGMVAADWMTRFSDDFMSCTIINSSFRGFSPAYKRLLPASYLKIWRAFRSNSTQEREKNILKMISNRPENFDSRAREWAQVSDLRPMSKENFFRQLFAAASFAPHLKHPPCPVLVLNSLRDHMVSSSCSEEIARNWGAELRQHPTAGHDLPLDEPQWTIDRIKEFTHLGE